MGAERLGPLACRLDVPRRDGGEFKLTALQHARNDLATPMFAVEMIPHFTGFIAFSLVSVGRRVLLAPAAECATASDVTIAQLEIAPGDGAGMLRIIGLSGKA